MLLSFAVLFGMRYDVGQDHLAYLDGYINPFLHKEYEPLFALIRDTLSNAGVHPIVFFAVCAFIQVFCLFYFMKDCKFLYPALIVSLFMGQFFIHWMNGIRQDIAGCIFLCAITCVIDKRIVGFFTLVLISVGFHYSAVILFPFYFLYLKKDHYFNSVNVQYLLLFVVAYVAIYNVDLLTYINDDIFYLATLSGYEMYTEDVLERFAASKLETKPLSRRNGNEYQRITNAVQQKFETDFEYILGARNRTRDYLIPLLEFYYFTYTAQAALQLNRFLDGNRNRCIPLYFCLEWEKTSQSRRCFSEGWNVLQNAVKRIFAHAITLEILNQTEEDTEPVDYIKLQELISCAPGEDHRITEQIKVLTDCYRKAISDCPEMTELLRADSPDSETAAEVKFLFESVRLQFENTARSRPYSSYAEKFEEYSRKYLKRRGRSGMMLNLSEETLIFLTKICIKDQEKMRLNDVFSEFEARGVFLDNHSKIEVMHYYEKLNLIEKKSDSGDAQYVKRIL